MNKKVLSALLFGAMVASTGTFTSCIDNDEPAGIEELRGAKAELIRAKVAVEEANAQYKLAEAEYEKARAATEQANAQYRLAEVKWMEAKAEYAAAETAEKKAYAEKQIALFKLEMEQAAEESKATIANLKNLTARAEYAYEVALKQIEVAKTLGVNFDDAAISTLEENVRTAYQAVYKSPEGGQSLAEKVREAQENLYNAQLNKANGLVPDFAGFYGKYIPELKQTVKTQEANVAAKKETVTKLESFLEKDVETTDWRAELETLSDSIEILGKAIDAKQLEITKALNSEEYLAADQKVNGVTKDDNVLKDGTVQLLEKAVAKYNATAREKKLNLSQIKVSVNGVLEGEINAAMTALGLSGYQLISDAQGNKYILIENTKEADGSKKEYYQPEYDVELTAANGYTPAKALEEIEAWTKILNEAAIDANEIEQFKRRLTAAQKAEHDADSVYNQVDLPMWESALAVMDGKAATVTIPAAETKKVTDAITAYNTKVNALSAAVTAYNDTYQAAYKAKYDEQSDLVYYTALKAQAENDLADSKLYQTAAQAQSAVNNALIGLTSLASKIAAIEGLYVTTVQDIATTEENERAEAQKDVNGLLAANKAQANVAELTAALTEEETWKAEAKDYVENDATVQETLAGKETAMETAKTAVVNAYNAMSTAVDAYRTLAKNNYALVVPTEGAANVPSTPATYEENTTTSLYQMKGAAITAETAGKMVLLTLSTDAAVKEAAWNQASQKAFGEEGRYVVPSKANVQGGSYGNWLDAQNDLQNLKDEIAATDKLDEVKKALAEGKNTLLAEEKANLALFADLDAAIKAADKANEAAKEELAAIEETLAGNLNIEKAKLEAKKTAVTAVQTELQSAISNYLHLSELTDTTITYEDAEAFIEALEEAVRTAEAAVIESEKALARAKVALEKAENGEFDAVADAQFKLDILMTEYNLKVAQYEKALANLQKALEIMAAE